MTTAQILLAYKPSDVKPGWVAFFIVMLLIAGTVLLWRNMNKQLHKIKVPHGAELREAEQRKRATSPPPSRSSESQAADDTSEPPVDER